MSDPAQLEATVSDLRKRMEEIGCVFDFTVSSVPIDVQVSDADHRHALEELFEFLRHSCERYCLDTIARELSLDAQDFFRLEYDISLATATQLDVLEVGVDGSSRLQRLEQAFIDPPYGSRGDEALFAEFCAVIGLTPNAVVLDWVGDPTLEPERSDWSNYFDAGKEWWGVWCATIWNPATRTLAAIAASSTD